MLINKEEINKYMQQEYEFVEKKIRALEKHLTITDGSEIAVSIEIPFATNQEGINCVVDDERLLITITNDELKN